MNLTILFEYLKNHEACLVWLTAISLFTFVATLLVVHWLIVHMPADYFTHESRRRARQGKSRPVLKVFILIIKNALGAVLVLTGIVMLFIPGQGLLTIVIGIVLLDFPGKYEVERRVVSYRPIRRSINGIRRRAGRPPLAL